MTTGEAACAVRNTADSLCEEAMQCGQWVGNVVQNIIKAFTNASSLHSKLRTLGNPVADVATVDALGYVYSRNLRIQIRGDLHSCGCKSCLC